MLSIYNVECLVQRSILEADQEEENEEAGDMNDEELNQIIARTDQEVVMFREIDIKRERDAMDTWRMAGNRGKPPPPLMQFEELPECYQADEPFEIKEMEDVMEGRGQRRRNVVNYNDGLSDEQWAIVRSSHSIADLNLTTPSSLRLSRRVKICRNWRNEPVARKIGGRRINS